MGSDPVGYRLARVKRLGIVRYDLLRDAPRSTPENALEWMRLWSVSLLLRERFRRVRYLLSRRRFDDELADDIAFHRAPTLACPTRRTYGSGRKRTEAYGTSPETAT